MLANIIAVIIICIFIILAVVSYIKQRKQGGCGCANCTMKCHSNEETKDKLK